MATEEELATLRAAAVQFALEGKIKEATNVMKVGKAIEKDQKDGKKK
jgi:hypothetical protein